MSALPPIRLMLFLAAASLMPAEIIDRMAVSVGNRVITANDIDRAIRVTTFQNQTKPDFSPANRYAIADRLIEQTLIRTELESSRYPLPNPAEIEPALQQFKRAHFKNDDEYRAALKEYGLTEQDLKDEMLWQRTLLLFIEERFRPAIQVDEEEIEEYFTKQVAPLARAAHPEKEPSLADYRTEIEETLAGNRVDEEMSKWLTETKRRILIYIHPEVFQ